jgi:excisionase family DNA binding protein
MLTRVMTAAELAEYFGIPKARVYRMLKSEAEAKLFGFRVGGAWRIDLDQMREWICQKVVESETKLVPVPSAGTGASSESKSISRKPRLRAAKIE